MGVRRNASPRKHPFMAILWKSLLFIFDRRRSLSLISNNDWAGAAATECASACALAMCAQRKEFSQRTRLWRAGQREKESSRSRQDSNLRGQSPFDFESNALTARPRLLTDNQFSWLASYSIHKYSCGIQGCHNLALFGWFVTNTAFGMLLHHEAKPVLLELIRDCRGAIHQFLRIIPNLRILVLLPVSTLPYVVEVKNYS
jgi:hypothetical protein